MSRVQLFLLLFICPLALSAGWGDNQYPVGQNSAADATLNKLANRLGAVHLNSDAPAPAAPGSTSPRAGPSTAAIAAGPRGVSPPRSPQSLFQDFPPVSGTGNPLKRKAPFSLFKDEIPVKTRFTTGKNYGVSGTKCNLLYD